MRSASSPRGCAGSLNHFRHACQAERGVGRQDTCKARVDRYSSGSGMRKTTFRSPSNRRPTAAHGLSVDPPAMTSMLQSSYPRQRARGERARGPPPPIGILVHAPYFLRRTEVRGDRVAESGESLRSAAYVGGRSASPGVQVSFARARELLRAPSPPCGGRDSCRRPQRAVRREHRRRRARRPPHASTGHHRSPAPSTDYVCEPEKSSRVFESGSDGTRTRDLRRDRPAF